jgi:hypothetical protein
VDSEASGFLYMNELKNKPFWYVSLIYFVNAALLMPILFFISMGMLELGFPFISITTEVIIGLALLVLMIPVGALYGSRYVQKRYVIFDSVKIVNTSTMFFAVLAIMLIVRFNAIFNLWWQGGRVIFAAILGVLFVLFYLFSRLFLNSRPRSGEFV